MGDRMRKIPPFTSKMGVARLPRINCPLVGWETRWGKFHPSLAKGVTRLPWINCPPVGWEIRWGKSHPSLVKKGLSVSHISTIHQLDRRPDEEHLTLHWRRGGRPPPTAWLYSSCMGTQMWTTYSTLSGQITYIRFPTLLWVIFFGGEGVR